MSTQQIAWKIDPGHTASACEDSLDCREDGRYRRETDCPHHLLFHDREQCMEALLKWLWKKAEKDQLTVVYKPYIGSVLADYREDAYRPGRTRHNFRVTELRIDRQEDEFLVRATFCVQTQEQRSVQAFAEVDGRLIPVGIHETWVTVVDWRPLTHELLKIKGDEPHYSSWTVAPKKVVLHWGDEDK